MTLIDIGIMAFAVLVFTVIAQMLKSTWDQMEAKDQEGQATIDKHFKL